MRLLRSTRSLDTILSDDQMAAQARIVFAAHLVAAAEAAGHDSERVIETLDFAIVARILPLQQRTVLDEIWITDSCFTSKGVACVSHQGGPGSRPGRCCLFGSIPTLLFVGSLRVPSRNLGTGLDVLCI